MRNKIFSGLLFLSTAAVIIASVLIAVIMYQGSMTTMQRDLRQEATFIKMGLEQSGKSYLQALTMESGKLTRVTLIAPDGRVIYDNHVAAEKMLNHKDREEVQEALASGIGLAERMSDTLSEKTFYFALRLDNGDILRVARTTDSVFATVAGSIPYMIAVVLVVALVAMLLARRITDKMVLPLDQVDLENPLENDTYDELAPFLTRIAQQQRQVSEGLKQLRQKQNELAAITQSMNEGLILLNDRQNILSINDSAAKLFGLQDHEVVGKNILTLERGQEVQELLQKVADSGSGESLYQKDGRYYQLCGSSVGGRADGDHILAEGDIFHTLQLGAHKLCSHGCPSAVFHQADGAVLEALGLEVGQQILHRREEEAVIGGAGQHDLSAAEGFGDGIGHIRAGQVHLHYLCTLCTQLAFIDFTITWNTDDINLFPINPVFGQQLVKAVGITWLQEYQCFAVFLGESNQILGKIACTKIIVYKIAQCFC